MTIARKVSLLLVLACLCSLSVLANPIDESSDTLASDGLSCWAESNGRIVNTTPCTAGSPTEIGVHTIQTTQGKLAVMFNQDAIIKVSAIKNRNKLMKIQAFSKNTDTPIILKTDTTSLRIASSQTGLASKKCNEGVGIQSSDLTIIYKNGSRYDSTVCYDTHDGNIGFNHTIPSYNPVQTYVDEEYYENIVPTINNNYDSMRVYDLGVFKAKVTIDWRNQPFFGEKRNSKFWVIGYNTDLDTDLNDNLATVLDPYFNSSWTGRMTINLTCPASATGDQRCFFNDTTFFQFDHENLVTAGLSRVDGFDIRLVFRNDSPIDNDQNEIPFFNVTGFNQTNTTLMFKLQGGSTRNDVVLTAGVMNTSYYLYYNNNAATSQNYDLSQVFDRGSMDHNQTNLMMCFDFDNFTNAEFIDIPGNGDRVHNRCKTGIVDGIANEITISSPGAITNDLEPGVTSIGDFRNISGMGALGRAVSFNTGSATGLTGADSASFNFENFTFTAWWKWNASLGGGGGGAIIDFNSRLFMDLVGASTAVLRCRALDGANDAVIDSPFNIEQNVWIFSACVYYNNGTISQYIANSTSGFRLTAQIDAGGGTIDDFAATFGVGNRPPATDGTLAFPGTIDNVFVYNASLSLSELGALYNWTRPKTVGFITQVTGDQETAAGNTAPTVVLNTSIWPNGTSIHLNETVDVRINVSYLDADGDNGTLNGTFFVNNTQALFVNIGIVGANTTVTFNLSNSTFGRNATIYFNATGSDNQSAAATMVSSRNVTVANIPPPAVSNLTPTASQRVRQNFTINWNQTGDQDDPMSNLGWNTTVNGTAFCGRKNATTSCLVLARPAGQSSFNITTLDGENYTSNTQTEVFVDEIVPALNNITNYSIQSSTASVSWTTDEITNFTVNYSVGCTALNLVTSGTTFNQTASAELTGLTPGSIHCFIVTVNDNVTSEFGANRNESAKYNFTTVTPPIISGGGGGGGGATTTAAPTADPELNLTSIVDFSQIASQRGGGGGGITVLAKAPGRAECNIAINPDFVRITDTQKFITVTINNNEETSYSPEIGIVNETGQVSALHRLRITNAPGNILAKSSGQIGIQADGGILGGEPIIATNHLVLLHSRCADTLVEIETRIGGGFAIPFLEDIKDFFAGFLNLGEWIEKLGAWLASPIIPRSEFVKVYMLLLALSFASGAIIFPLEVFKKPFWDYSIKVVSFLASSFLLTALIVAIIRNVLG